uniref:Uncharacterized protein n=1 Tax=Helicotheca tamesis TaxID=374047 RepID=A0A7S2HCX7_9STRA
MSERSNDSSCLHGTKRKFVEKEESLYTVLNFDRHEPIDREYFDGEALIRELQRDPDAARRLYDFPCGSTFNHTYPLHQAVTLGASLDVVKALYRTYPDAIKMKEEDKYTACHLACEYNPSLEVLSFLLDMWPEATSSVSSFGNTLLHSACEWNTSAALIKWLLYKYPDAACKQNNIGLIPINWLFYREVPLDLDFELIKSFVDVRPESTKLKDHNGWTILHYASAALGDLDVPFEAFALILEKNPDAARARDNKGKLPLHHACHCDTSLQVVALLLDEYPDAIKMITCFIETPLHIAVQHHAPTEVIAFLLEKWPDAVLMMDYESKTPFSIAKMHTSVDIKAMVSGVYYICHRELESPIEMGIIQVFVRINWIGGVVIIINRHPDVARKLQIVDPVIPTLLTFIGRRCNIGAMWGLIRNRQDLMSDL